MRVKILSIGDHSEPKIVEFAYRSGGGLARWKSNDAHVPLGKEVDVEMDIDLELRIGQNAALIAGGGQGIFMAENGEVVVVMVVEGQDDDGMLHCRVGGDCLVMIEAESEEHLAVGTCVSLLLQPRDLCLTAI